MILKQCENWYVDWPIGGAITVTKVYKCCISMADPIKWLKMARPDLHRT